MHDERDSTEGAHCIVSASIMFTDCSAAPSDVVRNGLSPCSLADIDHHVMERITQSVEVEPCSGLDKWVPEGDWKKALRYVRGGGHTHSECKDINQTTTITTS
ncbi:hypothetical protein AAVH_21743 [Aphelenchoides avenae]|nr:hypothetical protein AAVH_21743 [Aphelenchus avenae]